MAKVSCEFFPDQPAAWSCGNCQTRYSEKCIPAGHSGHWGRQAPGCIRCNTPLTHLGRATDAKPFWQMLPHFFLYPLHPNSLLVVALVVAGSLLLGGGWLSLLLLLFGVAVVVKYSFAIIEHRGSGSNRPPEVTAVIRNDSHHLFLKQIAVLFLMGVIVGLAAQLSEWLALLVAGFMTLAMPASIMILAVEKSVRQALNPFALLALMLAVGWPYLLLWVCVQIISAGPVYLLEPLATALPAAALFPVLTGLMVYFTFVLYTMLGYVLFEYHHELGFETQDEEEEIDEVEFEKARALGETSVLIKDAEYERARKSLRKALDRVRDDIELHLHYHKLLMLLDDDESLGNHGEYLLTLLAREKQLGRGVPVVLELQQRLPGFQPDDTALALELAELLRMQGRHKAVIRLFHNRHKSHPNDPLLPAAYLQVARVFTEYLNDDHKALAISQFVLKKFPRCEERAQFEQLQNAIQSPA